MHRPHQKNLSIVNTVLTPSPPLGPSILHRVLPSSVPRPSSCSLPAPLALWLVVPLPCGSWEWVCVPTPECLALFFFQAEKDLFRSLATCLHSVSVRAFFADFLTDIVDTQCGRRWCAVTKPGAVFRTLLARGLVAAPMPSLWWAFSSLTPTLSRR